MVENNKKIVHVIGSGISGATISRILADNGYLVKLYEKNDYIGGNCHDLKSKDNILYHKFGPHIFHTENEKVINFIKPFFKTNNYINKVGVKVNKIITQLPFNFKQIRKLDPKNASKIISYLKVKFPNQKKVSILEIKKYRDFEPLNKMVDWVFDNIYAPYTSKMWGIKIEDIDPSVIARVSITLSDNESYFPTAKIQGLPIGGYTKMISSILDHKNINLILKTDALKLFKFTRNFIYLNSKKINDLVIYCGPIEALNNYKYGRLQYRSLHFVFNTYNLSKKQIFPIINLPLHKTKTRTVEYTQMTKQKSNKTIISSEYPGAYNPDSKYWNIPYYPINDSKNNLLYNKYKNEFKNLKNFYLLGRLAEYKYLDMDAAILSALNLSEEIIK